MAKVRIVKLLDPIENNITIAGVTVKEEDGTPSVGSVTEIRVPNGSLTNNGSNSVSLDYLTRIRALVKTESDYLIDADDYIVLADAENNTVEVSLPASPNQGQMFIIKCIDATETCTISGNGNNIDGSARDLTLVVNSSYTLVYDASFGWAII